jgi:hypothetical protein
MSAESYAPSFVLLVEGTELRHGVTVDVLSISVTETSDRADTFAFSLRDRHPQPARFAGGTKLKWLDDGLFDEFNAVEIELGYVGNLRKVMVGEITSMAPSFPESGMPILSVSGRSLYSRLQRGTRREPFEASTDSGIAEEIARAVGFSAEVDRTAAEHPLFSPGGSTYDRILRERAERIGFEVTIKETTLYFQKPRYLTNPSPAMTLEWGRSLLSFSPTLNTYDLVTKVTVRGAQTSQGGGTGALVGTASAGDERVKLGATAASQLAQTKEIVEEEANLASQQEANDIALARLEGRSLGYIQGSGSCVGSPGLQPRTVVELSGLGERFSGKYYVTSVTHTIGGSGYNTSFQIKRNAQ